MMLEVEQKVEDQEIEVASGLHGVIGSTVNAALVNYVRPSKLGYVLDSSTTFDFQDGQPKRQPDVAFVNITKIPSPLDEELKIVPDLAVEIVSKNDTAYDIARKIKQYQDAGVQLIWVVYPVNQTVSVFRLTKGPLSQTLGLNDTLSGEEVIKGFSLPVRTLFE